MNDPWEDGSSYVDTELAKALSHPLRVKILGELNKQVMSPNRFAKRFGVSMKSAANQFGALHKAGCIEIVHEDDRGKGVEHWYRATKKALFDDSAWERLPETIRNQVSARTVGDLFEAATVAMREGTETFDSRTDRHAAWGTCHLDEQGWEEMSLIERELVERLMRVARESRSRLIRSGEEGLMGTWGVLLFESPFEVPESPGTAPPTSERDCASTRTRGG